MENIIQASQSFAAPALARGIGILRELESSRPLSLDALARRTDLPKSSLIRLLDTLIKLDLVIRDPQDNTYRAQARIVPLTASDASFEESLSATLNRLATQTGQTAEWYVPGNDGMVLVKRQEAPGQEVRVRATLGFVRPWVGELDAVAALGLGWFRTPPAELSGFNGFRGSGQRQPLSSDEVDARIEAARRHGCLADPHANDNGVRRTACVVLRDNNALGVMAVAEFVVAHRDNTSISIQKSILAAAEELNCRNTFSPTIPE